MLAVFDVLRTVFPPFGALFKDHFECDHEQHDATRNPECIEADAKCAEKGLAENRKGKQQRCRDDDRPDRHAAPVRRWCAGGQAGENRRATRRVDDHEKRDESRDEQLDHFTPMVS